MSGSQSVGRLAPSPTGALHLGNARTFLLAWLSARQAKGKVFLRLEDLDSPRVKPWAIQQTVEDLEWLGLNWDASNPDESSQSHDGQDQQILWLQTQRLDAYEQVLDRLIAANQVYPCWCSRTDVAEAASAPHADGSPGLEGHIYPGSCRSRSWTDHDLEQKHCWRWRLSDCQVSFFDEIHGEQSANPLRQLGDFVVARSAEGRRWPAYQLAVVVDDYAQGVNEIVRGDDLLFSTYRQLAIIDYFQWPRPNYVHVPLIVGSDGRRLAKRHGDTRLRHLREEGIRPEAVVGYLAYSLGWFDRPTAVSAEQLLGNLDWKSLRREPTVFDLEQTLPLLRRLA
ncbi:MAG: tRNA glutamyl-Q(34) synthetase GluQRS [bacterium]|nr:tRNA glutamyl-Q(34) synthetase GluQRS [bacterium]